MSTRLHALIAEDSPDDAELILLELSHGGFEVVSRRVETADEMQAAFAEGPWDIVLSDYSMPGFGAGAALVMCREHDPDLPFVVISGTIGEDRAVEIMRTGANDYLLKGSLARLTVVVERELREVGNRRLHRQTVQAASLLAAIVESSDDAIHSETLEGIVTSWNPAAERLYGWRVAEVLGRHISFIVPPDRADELAAIMERLQRGEELNQFETVRLRRDGTRLDVSLTVSPIRDRERRLTGISKVARDISARKQAERERSVLQSIIESSPGFIAVATLDFQAVFLNRAGKELLGLEDAEVHRSSIFDYLDEAEGKRVAAEVIPVLLAGGHQIGEGKLRHFRTGEIIPVDWSVFGIPDPVTGQTAFLACVANDSRERQRATQALKESQDTLRVSEARFRALVEGSWDGVTLIDAAGTILYATPATTRVLGYPLEEYIGRNGLEFVHPDDQAESMQAFAQVAAKPGGSVMSSYRYRRRDGSWRWVETIATNMLADPDIQALVLNSRDVTEQRTAQESLQRDSLLLANVRDAVTVTDLNDIVTYWNDGAARVFGWTAEEMLGRPMTDRVPESDRARMAAATRSIHEGGEFGGEWEDWRKDGSRVWIDARVTQITDPDGRVVGILGVSHDITERKRAEAALRASEQEFRLLAEAMPQIVWVTRPDGWTTYFNHQWTTFTGLTLEESLGNGWNKPFHPEDRQRAWDDWHLATNTIGEYALECRLRRADGAYRWFLIRGVPVNDDAGTILKWFGTCTDIDDFKRVEVERIELLNQLNLQIERMPLAYLLSGADFRYTRWNPAAERLFGYKEEEILGKLPFEVEVPPQSRALVEEVFTRLRGGDMNAHGTCENVTKDGRTVICEWHNTPFFGSDGAFQGILSLAQDVTARHRAERALHLRDRAILAATQALLIADASQPDFPIVFASPAFERITGYGCEEVLGRNCRFLQGKDTDPAAVARVRAAIQAEEACTVELLNYKKDGKSFWNELSISPVRDAEGKLTHFVGVLADITSRRTLEEQFRQAQKMEAFGQLAGGVAHDFNNLLTIINGFSDLLLQMLTPEDGSRKFLTEIRKAGERSAALTRQLLAFSRRQILALRILNLNDSVNDIDKILRRTIGEDIRLTTTLASNLWAVQADTGQVEQVLLNLAVNARDAMPTGGRLTIETQNVVLDETCVSTSMEACPGPHVLLSVTDTGTGMSPEVQTRIFEPFFTTKELGKGTGFGLATVYGIVKHSGGHIAVTSEVGVGTTFNVYLPRAKQALDAAAPTRIVTPPHGTETILLAEDEPGVRSLTRHVLADCGYKVLEAADGDEALRVAGSHDGPIHLLIADVVMPGAGGRIVAEQMARRHPGIRVLFISGYTDDAVLRHGVLRERVDFLQKPFSSFALAFKVREVLDAPEKSLIG